MIADLGWDSRREHEWQRDPSVMGGARPGRVIRVDRNIVHVALDSETVILRSAGLVIGDWISTDGTTLLNQLPRRTELVRKSPGRTSSEQVLAANVDCVVIVEPLHPVPNLRRIERFLTLAWASGANPVIVLTKSDIAEKNFVPEVESVAVGVTVIAASSQTGENLDRVRGLVRNGETFVLVGPSGAGKSSLVNALAGASSLRTGDIREDGKGRHTTTHRELIVIDGLGCLIDSPGIRAVGMAAQADGLEAAFEDVLQHAAGCRFHDCTHCLEPGCSVLKAVEDGQLDGDRVANFQRIAREIAHQSLRRNTHDRRDERLETKGRRTAKRVVMDAKGRSKGK